MDLWTMRCRAPGRLPWKSLATFPPRVPSPTSSTELYSFRIISWKVKTNRITGQSTATGKVPLIKERFLSKQTGPPLRSSSWMRAKVEHPFHGVKNLFQFTKVRYKGLAKNTAQLYVLFGLANLVLAKRRMFALRA